MSGRVLTRSVCGILYTPGPYSCTVRQTCQGGSSPGLSAVLCTLPAPTAVLSARRVREGPHQVCLRYSVHSRPLQLYCPPDVSGRVLTRSVCSTLYTPGPYSCTVRQTCQGGSSPGLSAVFCTLPAPTAVLSARRVREGPHQVCLRYSVHSRPLQLYCPPDVSGRVLTRSVCGILYTPGPYSVQCTHRLTLAIDVYVHGACRVRDRQRNLFDSVQVDEEIRARFDDGQFLIPCTNDAMYKLFLCFFFFVCLFVCLFVCVFFWSFRCSWWWWFVGWLVTVPTTDCCISGTNLLRQLYVLPQ